MDVVASVCVVLGGLLTVLAAVGMLRFPDVFTRMHAATKPATLGLTLILLAVALVMRRPEPIAKLGLVVLLQFTTAPIAAHMVGRAAFRAKARMAPDTVLDEQAGRLRGNMRPRRRGD